MKFVDGLKDVFNGLVNKRNASNRNVVSTTKLSDYDMRAMYRTGLMSKIIRLKVGFALNDTMQFSSTEDKTFYNEHLAAEVKKASKYMLGFGRGVLIMFERGDDLKMPLTPGNKNLIVRGFSGDDVTANATTYDLTSPRYLKPKLYYVNGKEVHYSRVVDFTYYMPVECDLPDYDYGGISESELIYAEFVNDGVVQRASGSIIEKASTFVYKIKGYKDLISRKKESDVVSYVSTCEDGRSIYGALITDAEDSVEVLTQTLTDLDKVNDITLSRLAMVTGLSKTALIGEQPSGMNADGASENKATQDTVENLQSDYLLEPVNYLAKAFGLGVIKFKENQGQTPIDKVKYEKEVADTARVLYDMGEDAAGYLRSKDIIPTDNWEEFWGDDEKPAIKKAVGNE